MNWRYWIRLLGLIIIGLVLLIGIDKLTYSIFISDFLELGISAIVGVGLIIWSAIVDVKQFRKNYRFVYLSPIVFGIALFSGAFLKAKQIQANFDKPTLLKFFNNVGIGAVNIDLKSDGTYIIAEATIVGSSFVYGEYVIRGNEIELEETLETSRTFVITEDGVFEGDDFKFKLIEDNR